VSEMDAYAEKLLVTNPLREPVVRAVIRALQLPQGSRGLDAGCGIGLQALLLAEAVGPAGHVTGLDVSPGFLARAAGYADQSGLSERVSFQKGDVNKLPFDDGVFDWIWSADCAGYPARAPVLLVQELARVVKPGGSVAILIYASQMLLPGHPLLEARLNATATGIAPFTADMRPEWHHLRALGWFRDAGLEAPTARTFVGSFHAPLSAEIRDGLAALLEMRWGGAASEVSREDWAAYRRLCQPESPDFILNLPDYYGFFTYVLFHGTVPA
jgi:ubiquinone/menaquinone biosynthesis C-methylase UbiE